MGSNWKYRKGQIIEIDGKRVVVLGRLSKGRKTKWGWRIQVDSYLLARVFSRTEYYQGKSSIEALTKK